MPAMAEPAPGQEQWLTCGADTGTASFLSATCTVLGNIPVAVKQYAKARLTASKIRAIKREAAMMALMTRKQCAQGFSDFGLRAEWSPAATDWLNNTRLQGPRSHPPVPRFPGQPDLLAGHGAWGGWRPSREAAERGQGNDRAGRLHQRGCPSSRDLGGAAQDAHYPSVSSPPGSTLIWPGCLVLSAARSSTELLSDRQAGCAGISSWRTSSCRLMVRCCLGILA